MNSATQPAGAIRFGRIPGLDGLRAIAITTVLAFHVAPLALPGGFLGVDIFFVLSGFLITSLLQREYLLTQSLRLGQFWRRRARRLLPALAVMVTVVTCAAWAVNRDLLVGIGSQLVGAATFTSNWVELLTTGDYFAGSTTSLFGNLWSLGIEEQFYLVWPLVLLVALRRRRTGAVIAAAGAVTSVIVQLLASSDPALADAAYYATPARSFGLLLGSVVALTIPAFHGGDHPRRHLAVELLTVAALLGVIALCSLNAAGSPMIRAWQMVGASLLAAVLLRSLAMPSNVVLRLLDARPLRWLGVRSYGLYLWHLPLIVIADALVPPVAGWGAVPGRLGAVAVAVVVSGVSFRWVEMPVRQWGFRGVWHRAFAQRPRMKATASTIVAGVLAAVVAIAVTAPQTTELEDRLTGTVRSAGTSQ